MNHTQEKTSNTPPWGCLCAGGGILLLAVVLMVGLETQSKKEAQENSVDTLLMRYEQNEVTASQVADRIIYAKSEEERTKAGSALVRTMLSPVREKRLAAADALDSAYQGLVPRLGQSGCREWTATLERNSSLAEAIQSGMKDNDYMVRCWISAFFGKPIADQLLVAVTGLPTNGLVAQSTRTNRGFEIVTDPTRADLVIEYLAQDEDENTICVWDNRSTVLLGISYQNSGLLDGLCFSRPAGRPVHLWVAPSAQEKKGLFDLRSDLVVAQRKAYLQNTGKLPMPAEIFKLVVAPIMAKRVDWVSQPDLADVKVELDWTTWKAGEWVRVHDNVVVSDALMAGLTIRVVNPKTNETAQTLKTEGWWSTSKVTRQSDDDPGTFAKRVNEEFIVNLVGAIYATP